MKTQTASAAPTSPASLTHPRSPASSSSTAFVSPTFVRASPAAAEAPASYLVTPIVDMLARGPERSRALIQTLVAHGTTDVLAAAFKKKPSLLDTDMLTTLASCGAGREFNIGISLRPDLADAALVLRLCADSSRPRFLAAVLRAQPALRDLTGPAGQSLAEVVSLNQSDSRLAAEKLDLVRQAGQERSVLP